MKICWFERPLALLLALVALPACGASTTAGAEGTTVAAPEAPSAPVLFRVTGAGGSSHLLGTIHTAVSLEEALPAEALRGELEAARVVVVEADPDAIADKPELLRRYAVAPAGSSLQQQLSPEQWQQLVAELGPVGLPAEALDKLRAWLPTMTLMLARSGDLGRVPSMDARIIDEARGRQQPLRFLETAAQGLDAITSVDEQTMSGWLGALLDEPEEAQEAFEALIAGYRAGDLEVIREYTIDSEDAEEFPEYIAAMFDHRNHAWMPALVEEFGQGGAFVAVGAGHLVGEEGLLRLLEKEGFTIERVGGER